MGTIVGELLPGNTVVISVFSEYEVSESWTAENPEGKAVAVAVAEVRLDAATPIPVLDGPLDSVDRAPEPESGAPNDVEAREVTNVVWAEIRDPSGDDGPPVA